jgi:glutathionyl-hydroquinone reductase
VPSRAHLGCPEGGIRDDVSHVSDLPFRPAPRFELGIRGGPVLPDAIVGVDPLAEPLVPEPGRYALVWSPVTPSGQKVALAAVLYGLLDHIAVLVPGRGRLEPDGEGTGYRWSSDLSQQELLGLEVGTTARTPTLVETSTGSLVSNDPYLLPYAFRELARRRRRTGAGRQPFLALDGDPAQEHHWDARIFEDLHVAVYRAGFVATQELYDEAAGRVHRFLCDLEEHLRTRPYLHGSRPTVGDLWLFSLLVRFDQVYGPGFRLHRYRVRDLPATQRYLRRLYAVPACTATTDFAEISAGYFLGIPALNRNVVPAGPDDLYLR